MFPINISQAPCFCEWILASWNPTPCLGQADGDIWRQRLFNNGKNENTYISDSIFSLLSVLVTQDICGNGSDVSHSETIVQKHQIEIKSYVFCCLTTLITLVRTTQNYNNHLTTLSMNTFNDFTLTLTMTSTLIMTKSSKLWCQGSFSLLQYFWTCFLFSFQCVSTFINRMRLAHWVQTWEGGAEGHWASAQAGTDGRDYSESRLLGETRTQAQSWDGNNDEHSSSYI